jgi:hypothetical protein
MCHPQGLRLIQKFSETLMIVAKDKAPQKGFTRRRPKKGVVLILRDIYPYNQILLRMPYLLPQLTKLLQPVTIDFIHRNLLLKSFEFGRAYSYLLTGGFFFG